MSEQTSKPNEQRKTGGARGPMSATPAMEKPKNMKESMFNLLKIICQDKLLVFFMIVLLFAAAALNALGPKALGSGTNILFEGIVSKQITSEVQKNLPSSVTIDQFKKQVDNPDGSLNVDKLVDLQKKQSANSAGAGNSQFESMKSMLGNMQIRLGSGVDFEKFKFALLWIILIYFASFLTRWIAGWISVRIIAKASLKLRQRIEDKIWRLPLKYFDNNSRGDVMSRTTNDLDNVTQTLNQTGGDLVYLVLMVISTVAMMFTVSPLLTVIALLTIPLSMLIIAQIMRFSKPRFQKQWGVTGELNSTIEESFTGHTLVKVYGKQDKFLQDFDKQNEELFNAGFKAQFISGMIMPIMGFITNLNYVLVAFIGAVRVANGQMNLGDVQAFIQYSRQYSQPVQQISQMINMLQSGAASAERIFELLDAKEESDESSLGEEKFETSGRIEFKNVSFSYTKDTKLIENMNLLAEPGKTIAIVGPTGAGKTTLVNLIMRFYEVNSGVIEIDGTKTSEISRTSLRKNIGMVLQDTWLFNGTIEANIKYGAQLDKDVTEEEFLAATKATYVDNFVKALPNGYKTVLDSEGSSISVGEKQLLTIARAFLADPDILILDEATSSVDTRTEVLVQKAMNKLKANRTSFVIAHRLSTIRDADVIVVMENGSIVEQGDHSSLIAKNGKYAKLYQSQFEGGEEETPEGGLFG